MTASADKLRRFFGRSSTAVIFMFVDDGIIMTTWVGSHVRALVTGST